MTLNVSLLSHAILVLGGFFVIRFTGNKLKQSSTEKLDHLYFSVVLTRLSYSAILILQAYVEDKKVEANHSFLTLKFYQQYFDVDTSQVLTRLATALVPNPRTNFIQHSLKPHADLYGPFWVATTLMLIAAIGGNISNYLQSRAEVPSWHYDFHKVTLTSSVIYVYWCLMPLVLYGLMHFRRNNVKSQSSDAESDLSNLLERSETDSSFHSSRRANKFFDILSAYGYSLTIYVPVVILWTIQSSILQWILFLLGLTVSGAFLVFSLTPNIRKEHPKCDSVSTVNLLYLLISSGYFKNCLLHHSLRRRHRR
ncbi:unnamed protein product [Heterobilharzia americana]|nr:unnamed protein product [Heterobilharzia americana]